jgi:hypothetical protein
MIVRTNGDAARHPPKSRLPFPHPGLFQARIGAGRRILWSKVKAPSRLGAELARERPDDFRAAKRPEWHSGGPIAMGMSKTEAENGDRSALAPAGETDRVLAGQSA